MAIQDLSGNVYGKLTVLSFAGQNKHGMSNWLCRCECGVEKVICSMGFKAGKTTSCGCHRRAVLLLGKAASVIHGKTGTREHHIWLNIIYRCCSPTCRQYKNYGGRGITVCERWRNDFAAFLTDMGEAPSPRHTVDRRDNDGPYSPDNCRWATPKEQAMNRRDNRILEFRGERKGLCEWAEAFGIHKATLHGRLARGWSVERALTTLPHSVVA